MQSLLKNILILVITLSKTLAFTQPSYPPIAFEDDYRGKANLVFKAAKVKIKRTYYKFKEIQRADILYNIFEYNEKGFLVSQKWYNLYSNKEMYSAYYEYDKDDFFTSCVEKITNEFDDFDTYFSFKMWFRLNIDGSMGYDMGDKIPVDKDGKAVVKTLYKRDSLGGYIAKKYFYDGSFYKEKECPFWKYGPQLYENLYVNKDKSINYTCSVLHYYADTLYQSKDTLNICIKAKGSKENCVNILKTKHNDELIITEIDRIFAQTKLYFSYENSFSDDGDGTTKSKVKTIRYSSYGNTNNEFLLIHKFQSLDSFRLLLHDRIELGEIHNTNYFDAIGGCAYYTNFKNGYLYNESQYAIGANSIEKLRDIYYINHNLVSEKVYYPACYDLERFSRAFNYNQKDNVIEINAYEYFD